MANEIKRQTAPYEAYCAFDPNWGDPIPLISTIGHTEVDAMRKAERTDECNAALYSGYSDHVTPAIAGSWEKLASYGYTVRKIGIMEIIDDA